jgi:UDP-glucuronate decarboxylase
MSTDDGRVVSNFIVQALQDKDITIYGDGTQTRSFCFVDDLVDALILCMNAQLGFSGPINIGNPTEIPIIELADLILNMTGSKSKIIHKRLPEADPTRRKPDISKITAQFNWKPMVSLSDGLGKTIKYFDELLTRKAGDKT